MNIVRSEAVMEWFCRTVPHVAHLRIISYFERIRRPAYLGALSLEVGYSLSQTAAMLDTMEDVGEVYRLDEDELRTSGFPDGAVVYALGTRAL